MPGAEDAKASGHRLEVLAALGSPPPPSCLGPGTPVPEQSVQHQDRCRVCRPPPSLLVALADPGQGQFPSSAGARGHGEVHPNRENGVEGLWGLTRTPHAHLSTWSSVLIIPTLPTPEGMGSSEGSQGPFLEVWGQNKITVSLEGKKSVGTSSFPHPHPLRPPAPLARPPTGLPLPPWPL